MKLEANALTCIKGRRYLFENLSFALGPGQALHVAGPNGSGKTSLLRIVAGLSEAEAGDIRWQGHPVRDRAKDFHSQVVYIGHSNAVKEDLLAEENILEWARLADIPCTSQQAQSVLQKLHLQPARGRSLRFLSQGQRRRLALAKLHLGSQRRLWILDEPFVGLDDGAHRGLLDLIDSHLSNGGMLLVSTHQTLELKNHSTRQLKLGN